MASFCSWFRSVCGFDGNTCEAWHEKVNSHLGTAVRTCVVAFSALILKEKLSGKAAVGLTLLTAGTLLLLR